MSNLTKMVAAIAASAGIAGTIITTNATNASAKTKFRYYQNIKDSDYRVVNRKAVIYSNGKINRKTGAKLGAYGTYVTGYYASHVTVNGKKSVYYKFKTDSGHTGWVWRGWLKKVSYKAPTNSVSTTVNTSSNQNINNDDTSFKFSNQAYVNEFVAKVNQARAQRGLQPLTLDAQLTQIADKRAHDITQKFTHYDTDGKSIFAKYAQQLNITTAHSEIIAYSMPSTINVDKPTSKDAADNDVTEYIDYDGTSDWGHRDILLNPDYNIIGVSATYIHEDVYDVAILGIK